MRAGIVVGIVAVVLVTLGMVRVIGNVSAMHSPPPACQVWGGQWDWWHGWMCA